MRNVKPGRDGLDDETKPLPDWQQKVLDDVVCHWKTKLFVIFFYDGLCFAVFRCDI